MIPNTSEIALINLFNNYGRYRTWWPGIDMLRGKGNKIITNAGKA